MKSSSRNESVRRRPTQRRALQTVDAILDAVIRILKREGSAALNTNRIAEVAGVSVGSLYQYFPDKRAIFDALHLRHVEQIDRVVEGTLLKHADASLDELVTVLFEAVVAAHKADPELHALLVSEVPHSAGGTQPFALRLQRAFRLALAARRTELRRHLDPGKAAFIVAHMVDALAHGVVQCRPAHVSLADARKEAIGAILGYLHGSA